MFPIPFAGAFALAWHHFLYIKSIHFSPDMEAIITCAWIPTLGLFYAILAGLLLSTVWDKYKTIRLAVKDYDIDTFANLRDENLSPLMYVLLCVVSSVLMTALFGMKYHDWLCGCFIISTTTYIFTLVVFIIMEIDNPFSGLWFIRRVHSGWLELNVKEWRTKRIKGLRAAFYQKIGKTPPPQVVK